MNLNVVQCCVTDTRWCQRCIGVNVLRSHMANIIPQHLFMVSTYRALWKPLLSFSSCKQLRTEVGNYVGFSNRSCTRERYQHLWVVWLRASIISKRGTVIGKYVASQHTSICVLCMSIRKEQWPFFFFSVRKYVYIAMLRKLSHHKTFKKTWTRVFGLSKITAHLTPEGPLSSQLPRLRVQQVPLFAMWIKSKWGYIPFPKPQVYAIPPDGIDHGQKKFKVALAALFNIRQVFK